MGVGAVRVSAVVLTWNSARSVGQALAALRRQDGLLPLELVVVDNGSVDDSPDIARQYAPALVIENPRNLGVARARNQGLRAAHGDYVLLLDSDAVMAPGSLQALVEFLDLHPRAGVVGPMLVAPDGTLQYSCRRFPTLAGKLLRQLPASWPARAKLVVDEEMRGLDRSRPQAVDYVIGACQLIRRSTLDAVGLLDERMFYGPEDVDFCLRAWQAGWEVWYVPAAVVVHDEQRVTRRRPGMLTVRHGLALAYYFWKHRYLWRRPAVGVRAVTATPGEEGTA